MSYLTDWISQIVFFIFIATIISLLIPKSSHEKVIKLVFGLVIFLIFLQPIIQLFNINPDDLIASFELNEEFHVNESIDEEISLKKNDIQAQQHAYILEQLEIQINNLVEEELRHHYDLAISDISILLPEDVLAHESQQIDSIIFHVRQLTSNEIKEIEPITIPAHQIDDLSNDLEEEEQIKQRIAQILGLNIEQVTLVWEGE